MAGPSQYLVDFSRPGSISFIFYFVDRLKAKLVFQRLYFGYLEGSLI